MTDSQTRVVIDTNVFIRYLIRPSVAIRRLIEELWLEERIIVFSSPELFKELESVLRRESIQFYIQSQEAQALLETIQAKAEFTPTLGMIPAFSRDPKDDKFVACAIAAGAEYLITEDRDLLESGEAFGFKILTPFSFNAII